MSILLPGMRGVLARNVPPTALTNAACLYFAGSNQYATSSYDPSMVGTGDLTVECWFNTHDVNSGTSQYVFFLGTLAGESLGILVSGANTLQLIHRKAGVGAQNDCGDATGRTWHNVVMKRSGTNVKVFLDGVLELDLTDAALDMDLDAGCILADRETTPTYPFHGLIDNFRVWSEALEDAACKALWNSGDPVDPSIVFSGYNADNLEVDNRFEELSGSTVADTTGNGYTLTLANSPTWNQAAANLTLPSYVATKAVELDGATDWLLPFINLNSAIGSGEMTLYMRLHFDNGTSSSTEFGCIFGDAATINNYVSLSKSSGNQLRGVMRGDSGTSSHVITGSTPTNGQYYDLVVTRTVNASDGTLEFFEDGVSQGTITDSYLDDPIHKDSFLGRYLTSSLFLDGAIRCMAVWDEVLLDSEIAAITTLGDHDFRVDSGNYASQANLLNFLVALSQTNMMTDLVGGGHAIYQSSPTEISYP